MSFCTRYRVLKLFGELEMSAALFKNPWGTFAQNILAAAAINKPYTF
jgi:hypothetical protein